MPLLLTLVVLSLLASILKRENTMLNQVKKDITRLKVRIDGLRT